MRFTDIFGLSLSILGIYSLILYPRFLISRSIIQHVSALLSNAQAQRLLAHAETIDAIPEARTLRMDLEMILQNGLTRMRMERHRFLWIFQQLWLAVWHGLTYRLYALSLRVDAIRVRVELAVDEHRLASFTVLQSAASIGSPPPTPDTAIHTSNVAVQICASPATTS